jgi:hypothetical protein
VVRCRISAARKSSVEEEFLFRFQVAFFVEALCRAPTHRRNGFRKELGRASLGSAGCQPVSLGSLPREEKINAIPWITLLKMLPATIPNAFGMLPNLSIRSSAAVPRAFGDSSAIVFSRLC